MREENPTGDRGADHPDNVKRPTFYMTSAVLQAIEAQAEQENTSRSRFVTSLLTLLLLSPLGEQLQANARQNYRTLAQELEQALVLFEQQLPQAQIDELAHSSQRYSSQMLVYLVLLGLQAYQQGRRLNSTEGFPPHP